MAGKTKQGGQTLPPDDDDARDPLLLEVGLKILNARRRAGLRQTELADRAGVTHSTVFMGENGKQNLSVKSLQALADALGLRARDLLPGEDLPTTGTPEALQQVADTLVGALGRATLLVQQVEGLLKVSGTASPTGSRETG